MGFIDSGILSMITMLNLLTINPFPLSKLVKELNKYARLDETNFHVKNTKQLFAELEKNYQEAKIEHIDGLSVNYNDWWFNLRESNTEPVVRLVMGAANKTILEKEKTAVLKIIDKYK
jgi:phosphomannomutase